MWFICFKSRTVFLSGFITNSLRSTWFESFKKTDGNEEERHTAQKLAWALITWEKQKRRKMENEKGKKGDLDLNQTVPSCCQWCGCAKDGEGFLATTAVPCKHNVRLSQNVKCNWKVWSRNGTCGDSGKRSKKYVWAGEARTYIVCVEMFVRRRPMECHMIRRGNSIIFQPRFNCQWDFMRVAYRNPAGLAADVSRANPGTAPSFKAEPAQKSREKLYLISPLHSTSPIAIFSAPKFNATQQTAPTNVNISTHSRRQLTTTHGPWLTIWWCSRWGKTDDLSAGTFTNTHTHTHRCSNIRWNARRISPLSQAYSYHPPIELMVIIWFLCPVYLDRPAGWRRRGENNVDHPAMSE
jgi:hypothetical protein